MERIVLDNEIGDLLVTVDDIDCFGDVSTHALVTIVVLCDIDVLYFCEECCDEVSDCDEGDVSDSFGGDHRVVTDIDVCVRFHQTEMTH